MTPRAENLDSPLLLCGEREWMRGRGFHALRQIVSSTRHTIPYRIGIILEFTPQVVRPSNVLDYHSFGQQPYSLCSLCSTLVGRAAWHSMKWPVLNVRDFGKIKVRQFSEVLHSLCGGLSGVDVRLERRR